MDAASLKTVLANAGVEVASFMPLWERAQALAAEKTEAKSKRRYRYDSPCDLIKLTMPPVDAPTAFEQAHPVYTLAVPRPQIVPLWDKLMGLRAQTEHYPVILGHDEHLLCHFQAFGVAQPLSAVLAEAETVDARAWLDDRWDHFSYHDEEDEVDYIESELRGWWQQPKGAQPPDALERVAELLFRSTPRETWYLGLVGTVNSWEVPAYLSFGGWNECPPAAVHVALHRAWGAQYGAEIAVVEDDTIICRVTQPPATRKAARTLSRDQMMYAEDIVMQHTALAGHPYRNPVWFFWWD